ncbi:MAG: asparagine synthase (glutamine-hydrolyzing) [Sphingopyxis granuli]|uniref:asparagine synthase (glutamine-hydrolyzing) n=1 Tax=Sphingopyxis granuli TaxID=267128 RepID=UPI003C7888FB
MCGIIGGFWRHAPAGIEERTAAALDLLSHRGPDDSGLEALPCAHGTLLFGQRRLSIIDLSSGGHQPAHTADGALTIVYNGEIYNYRELREELRALGRIFTTHSDTEVLLAAWAEWGRACLTRLEGMFAFVVYDRRRDVMTCVRDAFGIKPLFIQADGDEFLFASEQPALAALRSRAPRPDLQRAYDYLVHGDYDSASRTFVEGVRHLLPGSLLEVDLRTGRLSDPEHWWRAPVAQTSTLSFDQAVEATREQFLQNIRLHLRSDVPLGAALSGGVDSSAVVCAMRHVEPKLDIHSFSYIADNDALSEEKWVDLVNETVGARAHKVRAGASDLARDLDPLIRAQGEPFGSTSIYAQYLVFQRARAEGIAVTLDGQGADELLAGYDGYPGQRMLSLFENRSLAAMHGFARAAADWPGRSYRRTWMELGRVVLPDWAYASSRKAMGRDFRPDWLDIDMLERAGVHFGEARTSLADVHRGRRVIEQLGHSLQHRGLAHLLRHGDRNAMAFSIESRVPFLTIPMAELLLGFPEDYLISDQGETKRVFRAAMRGIVPDAILDRRDKIGFATPEREWLAAIAPVARGWLADAAKVPFIREHNLTAAFDAVLSGRRPFSWQLWRWINYTRWYVHQGFELS